MSDFEFDSRIYQNNPQIVLGFHGCDESVALKILNSRSEHLHISKNTYDWLGNGIYFWLNDPQRAYEWAVASKNRNNKIVKPYVIGAVINLGLCLNLCERSSVQLLQTSYEDLKDAFAKIGKDISGVYKNKAPDEGGFNLIRPLDCAVIEHAHIMLNKRNISYDSVYGYFQEGKDAFMYSGIKEKSHVQICVRNTDCIKGYFLPREVNK